MTDSNHACKCKCPSKARYHGLCNTKSDDIGFREFEFKGYVKSEDEEVADKERKCDEDDEENSNLLI